MAPKKPPTANPYSFTEPVRDPVMFFGRRQLLDEIVANFGAPNPHSFVLYGGRRFGKTSLLRAVERELLGRLDAQESLCVLPIYIDLNYEIIHGRGAFFVSVIQHLMDVIGEHVSAVNAELDRGYLREIMQRMEAGEEPLPLFERAFTFVRNAAAANAGALHAVLLIDETERILSQPWASELHANLRALLSNRPRVQDHLGIKLAGSSNFYAKITEEGSPLRNILLKRLLLPLAVEESSALIDASTDGTVPEQVRDSIVALTGGHPFLVQYLMYYLWESDIEEADVDAVHEVVDQFHDERDDFGDWCEDIGPVGEAAFAMIASSETWVKRSAVYAAVSGDRTALKSALEALTYHGVVSNDRRKGYRVKGTMFRDWFGEYRAEIPPASSSPSAASAANPKQPVATGPDRDLRENLASGNVCAFVGAGLSIGAGLPGWYALIQDLAERIEYDLPPVQYVSSDTLIDAAQAYVNQENLQSLIAILKERLDTTGRTPTSAHRALAALPISTVFTANYDDLLERAYKEAGKRVNLVVTDSVIPFMSRDPDTVNVIKLFGDLDQPETIVFARQQYEGFFLHRPQVVKLLEDELARSTMLYLGWSHSDPYFGLVFGEMLNRYGEFLRQGYAAMFNLTETQALELKRKQIRVVELPEIEDRTDQLTAWLKSLS